MRGIRKVLSGCRRGQLRIVRTARRRDSCAGRREWRRQKHADQDPHRRAPGGCRRDHRRWSAASRSTSPLAARRAGIATIYQEFTLVPTLDRARPICSSDANGRAADLSMRLSETTAGARRCSRSSGVADRSRCRSRATSTSRSSNWSRSPARWLTDARILVMDEPTAALTPSEVDRLFELLRDLAARGIGIIFISHRLDEVFAIADRITVMRDGQTIATREPRDLRREHDRTDGRSPAGEDSPSRRRARRDLLGSPAISRAARCGMFRSRCDGEKCSVWPA